MTPRVAVVVPVFEQAAFLGRALGCLLAQDLADWEAVVVDDGSTDDPLALVPDDPRLSTVRHEENRGLGAACNSGLDATTAPVVAYLPADDAWDADHLSALLAALLAARGTDLVHSGVRTRDGDRLGAERLELVQVAHRRTGDRWTERAELESDDLSVLMWSRLGPAAGTGRVTCTWTDHPHQRSKAIREAFDGGVNVFRRRYGVREPLRVLSTDSGLTDEVALYERFRRPRPPAPEGLKVLLVGELSFNPERVLALADRGHELFGLWTPDGLGTHTVGPLPFGSVTDLRTIDDVRAAGVDVAYGLLNWRAVRFAAQVRRALPDLPFVWHFKEAPQACVRSGTWPDLVELSTTSDQVLFATEREREWMDLALPGRMDPARTGVLDGDLPSAEWFRGDRATRLSDADGEPHTVVTGRPLGLDADALLQLGRAGIHVHLHGQVTDPGPAGGWRAEVERARREVPDHLHVHPRTGPDEWVSGLSRYDAGWLHRFTSTNGGDLRRATWDDLNAPARIPTYAAAGLPMLLQASPGSVVAAHEVVGPAGLVYEDLDHLAALLHDRTAVRAAADASWARRDDFAFDSHADRLVEVLRAARG